MKYQKIVSLMLLLLFFGMSCNREFNPISEHTKYIYPNDEGKTRTYFVIDTIYQSASQQGFEAQTYYKREVINGTETDLLGREVSKLYLYTSVDSTDTIGNQIFDYQFSELWQQYNGDQFGERIEGNTRYQVLKIPVFEGLTWNGNLFNSEDTETYQYMNADTTVIVNGVSYDHCVFVLQTPLRVSGTPFGFYLIEHAYEIYAPHIGKIERYFRFYKQQATNDVDPLSRTYHEVLVGHN